MKITEYNNDILHRGTVLRIPSKFPVEEIVDFMIVDYPASSVTNFAIYCISGYYIGSLQCVFPKDALSADERGISVKWFIENMDKLMFVDCDISEVEVVE